MLQWFISFSEFTEFSESSAPFRKNSNTLLRNQNIDIDITFVVAGIQANLG